MLRTTTVLVLASGLLGCDTLTPEVEVFAAFVRPDLTGDVALESANAMPGSELDRVRVDGELGVEDPDNSFMLGASLDWLIGRLSLTALRYEQTGTGMLSAPFGDLPAGTPVATDISVDNLKAAWTFDLLDVGGFSLAPGLGLDLFDIDTQVRSLTPLSAFESFDVRALVPLLFLRGELDLGEVDGFVEGGYIEGEFGDSEGTFWDVEARLNYRIDDGPVHLFAGYRFVHVDGAGVDDGQRYEADIDLRGFFLGGGLSF